ncbi:hypothetical protein MBLNU459_g2225t1 [Dothideomycetes sp. NU459]
MSSNSHLTLPEVAPRAAGGRSSSSPALNRTPQRVDEGRDLGSHTRAFASGDDVHRPEMVGFARREHHPQLRLDLSGIDTATSNLVERTPDGGPDLARPVTPLTPLTPYNLTPGSEAAVKSLIAAIHSENPGAKMVKSEDLPKTAIIVGADGKKYEIHTYLLTSKVPFFNKLLNSRHAVTDKDLVFAELDDFGFALFTRWIYGGKLYGPKSFHSLQHYLCLYCMAHKWDIESLCNDLVDLVRAYYRVNNMTAPAFRIEYLYANTDGPNFMRAFMVHSAVFRALYEPPIAKGVYLSDSMQNIVAKGGVCAIDFCEATIRLGRDDAGDPRKGHDCAWHEHADGKYCPSTPNEPYQQ